MRRGDDTDVGQTRTRIDFGEAESEDKAARAAAANLALGAYASNVKDEPGPEQP